MMHRKPVVVGNHKIPLVSGQCPSERSVPPLIAAGHSAWSPHTESPAHNHTLIWTRERGRRILLCECYRHYNAGSESKATLHFYYITGRTTAQCSRLNLVFNRRHCLWWEPFLFIRLFSLRWNHSFSFRFTHSPFCSSLFVSSPTFLFEPFLTRLTAKSRPMIARQRQRVFDPVNQGENVYPSMQVW